MEPIEVATLGDPRLTAFRNVADRELRARGQLFLVEGRLGVRRLVEQSWFVPHALFVTPAACRALADVIGKLPAETPVYLGSQQLLNQVVGYNLHRGCLAAVRRGEPRSAAAVAERCVRESRPLVVLEKVDNPENVGNVFRNAVAFGAGGVWLSAGCADPLYRQATRVSMGGTLRVPFAWLGQEGSIVERLRGRGVTSVALTPAAGAVPIDAATVHPLVRRPLALLLGNEGEGLSAELLADADLCVRIPLAPGVDSLNVATASGIALHRLSGVAPA